MHDQGTRLSDLHIPRQFASLDVSYVTGMNRLNIGLAESRWPLMHRTDLIERSAEVRQSVGVPIWHANSFRKHRTIHSHQHFHHPSHTMSQSTNSKKEAMAQTTSASQQGDNIAHALAGAGGGLLSMTLTWAHT